MQVTKESFKQIKGLLADNSGYHVFKNSTFSKGTIYRIKKARNFKHYRELTRQLNVKHDRKQTGQVELLRLAKEISRHLDNARKLITQLRKEATCKK